MSLSFTLSDDFISGYENRPVDFGYADAAGNALGEITFLRTYSRKKEDGTKERWHEVCRRVIEGMFSIQKDHCKQNRLPWNDHKAQRSAQEAYDRLFTLKWTPPGRGLWMMGTEQVMAQKNSAALQSCAFVSTHEMTKVDPAAPFCWLMEASMLGIGVGFDDKGADKGFDIYTPDETKSWIYEIPDTREGWVESLKVQLESYLSPHKGRVAFDYSLIRPAGEPIKTFGGTAAGPGPLRILHEKIDAIFSHRGGTQLSRVDIVDVANLVGRCVVSGNVRRSALIALGHIDDKDFINLKNVEYFPERNSTDSENPGWGWLSNNSVEATVGSDYTNIVDGITLNGEPGVVWMDVTRKFGRLIDPPDNKDWRAAGVNPCSEQILESYELCTLTECFLGRHENLDDFKRTLKFAYLYAKTVTLLPTHWQRTNSIMQRNRRIGTSISGIANFADANGMSTLKTWMNEGYAEVRKYDRIYSEWMCVRESIRVTTCKPSGSVSILAGESPGVHWAPGGEFFARAIRFASDDPMLQLFRWAGYTVEIDVVNPETTSVVYFPVHSSARRAEGDVTLFEKANLAVVAQRYWSDNSVSVTLSFDQETEGKHVPTILHMHEGQLKTVSFLPKGNETYAQMPYTQITEQDYRDAEMKLMRVDFSDIYAGLGAEALGEKFCTTDACLVEVS